MMLVWLAVFVRPHFLMTVLEESERVKQTICDTYCTYTFKGLLTFQKPPPVYLSAVNGQGMQQDHSLRCTSK